MAVPGSGELDKKITIQSLSVNKGVQGGMQKQWQNHLQNIWAKVNNLSGNERSSTSHGGQVPVARTVFTIRYRPGITETGSRVLYKGQVFDIKHVNNFEEKNAWLVITCDTGRDDG